jgi:hypothetical protein
MKRCALSVALSLAFPQAAFAAENSPQVVIFSSIAMVVFVAVVLIYQFSAVKKSDDPDNTTLANQDSILDKLNYRLNPDAVYRVEVYRQSGNAERVEGPILGRLVAEKILTSMRRASITAVSITERSDRIDVRRLIHNGRGRQEGKRIGGYFITQISSPVRNLPRPSSADNKPTEAVDAPLQISSNSDAEAALIKSWSRIESQIPADGLEAVRRFVSGFDMASGKGEGTVSHVDFFLFLSFIDRFLCGEADITPSVREELGRSEARHHQAIYRQATRSKVRGIESFGVEPKDVKNAFINWFDLLSFADFVRENRPRVLALELEEYSEPDK